MNNKFIHLKRYYGDDNHSIGVCSVNRTELTNDLITKNNIKVETIAGKIIPVFSSTSLERGWLDNKPNVSCIPTGEYHCVFEYSPAFDEMLWEIYGVEGRSECKFHVANYYRQLKGCVSLGLRTLMMDSDNTYDLTKSKIALEEFTASLRDMEGKIVKLIVE
jgi:hypothetical protein